MILAMATARSGFFAPLATVHPWTSMTWPAIAGLAALGLVVVAGIWTLCRQRRRLDAAWAEVGRVWEQGVARMAAVGDLLPDALLEIDENRTLTFANRAFFQMTGYTEKDLHAGLSLIDLFVPAERTQLLEDLEATRLGRGPGVRTHHLRRARAQATVVALHLAPMTEDGRLVGWRGILQDIENHGTPPPTDSTARPASEGVIDAILQDIAGTAPARRGEAIAHALARTGAHLGVDRCYLYEDGAAGTRLQVCQQWYAKDVTPLVEDQVLPGLDDFPWMRECFARGERVCVPDLGHLPPAARVERERWLRQGITALLAVPMRHRERVVGVVGCEILGQRHDWDRRDEEFLQTVAGICCQARQREAIERRLQEADRRLVAVVDLVQVPAFVSDIEGTVIAWNPPLCQLTGTAAAQQIGQDARGCVAMILGTTTSRALRVTVRALRDGGGGVVGHLNIVTRLGAGAYGDARPQTSVIATDEPLAAAEA